MPQQSMGMRVAEELAERTANERKEIARLRRWCQDVTRQCSYGKSQRERDEEERARRFAEQEAAREREKMDAHAILLERQRREAELHKGNKLDGVLTKLERQIERDRVKKGVKRPVFAPAVHAVLRRHMAASALCLPPEKAENPSTRWVHALEDSEEKYLTSLFRKQLHSKAKGKGKGKADDKDKAHDRSAQQHDHAAGAVTLQELKDLIRMSGGGEVALRDLRKLAADYISRIQWVDGITLNAFLAFMFFHRQRNEKQFENVKWEVPAPVVKQEPPKRRPVKGVRPVSGIRRYIDVSEFPFLVDIVRRPTGKEGAAALSRLARPSTAGASVLGGHDVQRGLVGDAGGKRPDAARPITAARTRSGGSVRPATSMGLSRETSDLRAHAHRDGKGASSDPRVDTSTHTHRGSTRSVYEQDSEDYRRFALPDTNRKPQVCVSRWSARSVRHVLLPDRNVCARNRM
eukprot:Tamp_04172.p1 GENE.Tamp_04172~~Tamp_04172.p1  ORF type:complete len:486 (+),score=92.26 Tamp_04172:74-1459(+)